MSDLREWWDALSKAKRVQYRKALAEELIDGWGAGRPMTACAARAAINTDLVPVGEFGRFRLAEMVLKKGYIDWRESVKVAMPRLSRAANEQLWRGAKTETVRRSLWAAVGLKMTNVGELHVPERSRSKRHDWATCK